MRDHLKVRSEHFVSEANLAVGWDPDGSAGGAGRARALPEKLEEFC
jgi:hypothetical protein